MQNIIPNDSKYIPLTQQRWCCVPTCIQMVMHRHNIPLIPAELIGHEMGLIVPEESKDLFWNARTGDKPKAGYGTQVDQPEFEPNSIFKRLDIPLEMNWALINRFEDINSFKDYLGNIDDRTDILVCFDWGALFDDENSHHGHVCVLDKVDIANNEMRMIDPSANAPKWRNVKIDKIFSAMKYHGEENSGGFWELTTNY